MHPRPPASNTNTTRRNGPGALLTRAGAVVAAAVALGAADSWRRPVQLHLRPTSGEKAAPPGDVTTDPIETDASIADPRHITVERAFEMYEMGAPFLDARSEEEFAAGHVLNAFHLPPTDVASERGQAILALLDPAREIVIYCGGGECHDSENLAKRLQQLGYEKFLILTAGYPAWAEAGHETATGAE